MNRKKVKLSAGTLKKQPFLYFFYSPRRFSPFFQAGTGLSAERGSNISYTKLRGPEKQAIAAWITPLS
jgi:hypothetical protein